MAVVEGSVVKPRSPWEVAPIGIPEDHSPAAVPAPEAPTVRVAAARPIGKMTPISAEPGPGEASFVWVGAHGGAGVTSLAETTGQGVALSGAWPNVSLGWPAAAVVVCRSNAAGLASAARFLREWASGCVPGVRVRALVVVADTPGRPTSAARVRLRELSGAVPLVLSVPWVADWRDRPYTAATAVSKVASTVAAHITKER